MITGKPRDQERAFPLHVAEYTATDVQMLVARAGQAGEDPQREGQMVVRGKTAPRRGDQEVLSLLSTDEDQREAPKRRGERGLALQHFAREFSGSARLRSRRLHHCSPRPIARVSRPIKPRISSVSARLGAYPERGENSLATPAAITPLRQ